MAATITLVSSVPSTDTAEALLPPPPAAFTVFYRGEARKEDSNKTNEDNAQEEPRIRKKRSSSGGYEYNNLITAVYSVCCLYQFISYLPLLILRVCFGSTTSPTTQPLPQAQNSTKKRQRKSLPEQPNSCPGMATLAGLLLFSLPLMLLSSLPVIGRLTAASPATPSSRSRGSSISSVGSTTRAARSFSMSSGSDSLSN